MRPVQTGGVELAGKKAATVGCEAYPSLTVSDGGVLVWMVGLTYVNCISHRNLQIAKDTETLWSKGKGASMIRSYYHAGMSTPRWQSRTYPIRLIMRNVVNLNRSIPRYGRVIAR